MNFKLIIIALLALLAGCSSIAPTKTGTWRASVDNGDKPGIGIELIRTADGLRGWIYLLDPNKPGDFAAGVRRPMVIQHAGDQEILFSVQMLPTQRDELILRLHSPLSGQSVHGVLQSADGQDDSRDYQFTRTR